MERDKVYELIDSERDYQDKRWADTASSKAEGKGALDRTVDEFALYINTYARKLADIAGSTDDPKEKLEFVRKVAGLCVACMEAHGGNKRGA